MDPDQSNRYCSRKDCQSCTGRLNVKDMLDNMEDNGLNTKKECKQWKAVLNLKREGIIYITDCTTCLQGTKLVDSTYTGESSWSGYKRMREHHQSLESGDTKSALVTHAVDIHSGRKPKFIMGVTDLVPNTLR